nr:ribonuclease H-like domain-containing protein [Tanacetum cinerariifolium]
DHPRNVRPSLHNKKSAVNTKAISSVPNSKLNVNSDLKCATCNGCLVFDNHDSCVLEFINSVNARVKSKSAKKPVVQNFLWYLDSGCSKHMTGERSQLINFVQKFLGTVKFKNDHVEKIMGYGDYKIRNVTISRVYFVEGLGHNYSLRDSLLKLKLEKDHLCSACAMGKSKKKSHKPKSEDTNQEKLYLLHMDLCGPMHAESVNGKKYILVIVDDYSRFTWVKYLRSKDEALDFIIKFLKTIQVRLQVGISHETSVARSPQQNGPALNEMTPRTISSGLVPKPSSSTPYVLPSRNDRDLLFQLLFDELLTPSPSVDPPAPEVIALIADVIPPVQAELTGLPTSTTVDQDAPSPSK